MSDEAREHPAREGGAMKIYLSGPMSGLPDCNRPTFNAAAKRLRSEGHAVVNPAELPDDLSYRDYMGRACNALVSGEIDCVLLLPGWEDSPGATAEVALAEALGIKFMSYRRGGLQDAP